MPPVFLAYLLLNLIKYQLRKRYIKIFPIKLSDEKFLKLINREDINKLSPFFFNPNIKDNILFTVKKEYPHSICEVIKSSDDICSHIFNLLGSGKTKLGSEIDWHLDFKSGYSWNPKEYYLGGEKHINLSNSSDVKVPWELSRCQHFITLGKAYWYTNNEKYSIEYVKQIESWIANNPIELGVNWACTMDVAIRTVNWIWGYYYFCESPNLTQEFKLKLFKSLFLHGKHIVNNLEFGHIRGNHYLSDIVGLVYLGIFFKDTKEGQKWLKKGLSALEEEMGYQVHPDGVDFEASISYHRLVTELFLSATLLCLKNDIRFPKWYMDRLEKMIDFVMYYTKPDGLCPIIGDADDGRLHILADNQINDHRYLLSIGAILFNRNDFRSTYPIFNEESFWLLGIEGLNEFKLLKNNESRPTSKSFQDTGFYIMRKDDLYMIIHCGDVGLKGLGAHGHCDCLSFELFIGDTSVIIDPGTYVYTADAVARNLFRSTKYHNTIVVDGEEMNRFEKDQLFSMHLDAVPTLNKWVTTDEYDFFDGEHSGYAKLKNPVIHRRQIYFNKKEKYWIINDMLTGKGHHRFELCLHFSSLEIKEGEGLVIETHNKKGGKIIIMPLDTEEMSMNFEKGWISNSYGRKVEAPFVVYSKEGKVSMRFITVITIGQRLSAEEIILKYKEVFGNSITCAE